MEDSNQTPQAPEAHNQMPSPVNNSSGSKIIPIGLAVIVILVLIVAYLLGTRQNQIANQQPATTSPIILNSSPTLFPTSPQIDLQQKSSDVLTYRASSWSIGYPQGWNIQKDSKTGGIFFFEPQDKAFMSVQPAKLSGEDLNKYSSKEELKNFFLRIYSTVGISYVREENFPLLDKIKAKVAMRLITKKQYFDGISDILFINDNLYEIDLFVKTAISNEEKESLRSLYNEKILPTFVSK